MSIKSELLALKREFGDLDPKEIHAWAKSHPNSALHRSIDWNEASAAKHWQYANDGKGEHDDHQV
jgi:hypothetical protein